MGESDALCSEQKIMPMTKKTKTSQIYAYTNLEGGKKKFSIYRKINILELKHAIPVNERQSKNFSDTFKVEKNVTDELKQEQSENKTSKSVRVACSNHVWSPTLPTVSANHRA